MFTANITMFTYCIMARKPGNVNKSEFILFNLSFSLLSEVTFDIITVAFRVFDRNTTTVDTMQFYTT